jgi:hypothetical protein
MSANPELVQQARSADPDMRQKAAYLVSHSTDAGDYPLMFELLGDKDWRVRKTIVDGFVRDPQQDIIERLLDALADPREAVVGPARQQDPDAPRHRVDEDGDREEDEEPEDGAPRQAQEHAFRGKRRHGESLAGRPARSPGQLP